MYKDMAKSLKELFDKYGLDVIYSVTVIFILIHLIFDLKNYRNWENISTGNKVYTIAGLVGCIFFLSLSILRFFNVI
jgi:hypothetical protein